MVDEPDGFPPEFWQGFLQSGLTSLEGKCRPVCVGKTRRGPIAAEAMRRWRPRLEGINLEVRQFGVAIPRSVETVGPRARAIQEMGNWLIITDFSNAFNSVKMSQVLAGVANCAPAITPLLTKRYGRHRTSGCVFLDGLRAAQHDRLTHAKPIYFWGSSVENLCSSPKPLF